MTRDPHSAGLDRCNAHGVYEPDEVLRLLRDRPGWRGMDTASIELRDLGSHWIYATNYQLLSGDCRGRGEPLSDGRGARRASTREAALNAAADHLRSAVAGEAEANHDARRIILWLDSLNPAQADLFQRIAA